MRTITVDFPGVWDPRRIDRQKAYATIREHGPLELGPHVQVTIWVSRGLSLWEYLWVSAGADLDWPKERDYWCPLLCCATLHLYAKGADETVTIRQRLCHYSHLRIELRAGET